jgi:uncharacterized protein (TIGR03067 family)
MANTMTGVTVALLAGLAATLPAQTPVTTDSARLQGTWAMASGSADGAPLPDPYLAQMRRVLTGNDLIVTMAGSLYFRATVVLNPSTSPKSIDYHMTAGTTAGAVQLGIYEIRGDTVRFCFASPNAARPTDFSSTPGDGRTASTWIRAGP